jgi:hypothetical protein
MRPRWNRSGQVEAAEPSSMYGPGGYGEPSEAAVSPGDPEGLDAGVGHRDRHRGQLREVALRQTGDHERVVVWRLQAGDGAAVLPGGATDVHELEREDDVPKRGREKRLKPARSLAAISTLERRPSEAPARPHRPGEAVRRRPEGRRQVRLREPPAVRRPLHE